MQLECANIYYLYILYFTHYDAIFGLQLSFGRYQADEQAWVDTIKSIGTGATLRISTMDWLGQSQYMKQTVYWSSLSSAISQVTTGIIAF